MLTGADRTELPPVEAALVDVATQITEAPWAFGIADLERLRAVGLSDASILHVVVQSAFYSYLNRVIDAVGIDFDYDTGLSPFMKDTTREPVPRPAPASWPRGGPAWPLRLAERPVTHGALKKLREYVFEREMPLTRRERRVVARAAAAALCDTETLAVLAAGLPANEREKGLARFGEKLTLAPWRIGEGDVDAMRSLGLDDRAALDVVTVAAFQNMASRLTLVVGFD